MNHELNELERRLEQATARQLPAGGALDSETAALREGWLALGQLLEAVEATPAPASPPRALPQASSPWRWKILLAAAMATSLLVAGTLAWRFHAGADAPQQASKDLAPAPLVKPLPAAPRETQATEPGTTTAEPRTVASSALPEASWDESLDESIARVYQELIRIEQDSHRLGSASEPMSSRLEEIVQELEKSTI